jgi:hypothetical protein
VNLTFIPIAFGTLYLASWAYLFYAFKTAPLLDEEYRLVPICPDVIPSWVMDCD